MSDARNSRPARPTTTLVVEGGGLRGAFGAGVASELVREGVASFDDIVAVSAGAPTAAYLATQQIEDGVAIWRDYTHGTQLIALRNVVKRRPVMDLDRLLEVFRRHIPLNAAALAAGRPRLWICITDCQTGEARHVRATPSNVFDLLRATMAIPVAHGRIVDVAGQPSIDGGVVTPIPLAHGLQLGRDRLLLVLTRPRGYRRPNRAISSALIGWTYPRYPAVRTAMLQRAGRANAVLDQIDALERAGQAAVIRPLAPLPAARLSRGREEIEATLECGREAARAWLRANPHW
jgi:predicted patatin/cPLA2 family phospholipase